MTESDKKLGIEICKRFPVDLADVQGIIEMVRSSIPATLRDPDAAIGWAIYDNGANGALLDVVLVEPEPHPNHRHEPLVLQRDRDEWRATARRLGDQSTTPPYRHAEREYVSREDVIEECAKTVENAPGGAALTKHNRYIAEVLRGLKVGNISRERS